MTTTTETHFAPVLLNGEPLALEPEQETCYCRRCLIHDDPGGCLVVEAQCAVIEFMAQRTWTFDEWIGGAP